MLIEMIHRDIVIIKNRVLLFNGKTCCQERLKTGPNLRAMLYKCVNPKIVLGVGSRWISTNFIGDLGSTLIKIAITYPFV